MEEKKKSLMRRAGGGVITVMAAVGFLAGLTEDLPVAWGKWTSWLWLVCDAVPASRAQYLPWFLWFLLFSLGIFLLEPWKWFSGRKKKTEDSSSALSPDTHPPSIHDEDLTLLGALAYSSKELASSVVAGPDERGITQSCVWRFEEGGISWV